MSIDAETRCNLLNLLCQRGFYVPKGQNVLISNAMHQIVQEMSSWIDSIQSKPAKNPLVDLFQLQKSDIGGEEDATKARTTATIFRTKTDERNVFGE